MLSFERGKFFFRESLFQCVTVSRTVVKISFIVFNPGAGFRLCVCVCFDIAMVNIVVSVLVFMRAVWHDKPK